MQADGDAPKSWTDGLSTMTANALRRAGLRNQDEVRAMLAYNDIAPKVRQRLLHPYSLGRGGYVELCRWVGHPEPTRSWLDRYGSSTGKWQLRRAKAAA